MSLTKKTITISAFCLLASACTPTVTQRGNMLEDYQLQKVEAGTHTRTDVLQLLGSPTTQAPFDPNIWYYIGQETEKRGILDPQVVQERIVVVKFNEFGVVDIIEDLDKNRIDIPITDEKTPTYGNKTTAIQQILGNLGKFNPADQQR